VTRPSVLLLHGYSCSSAHWAPAIARLGGRWDLHAPDFPGHGDEPVPSGRSLSVGYCVEFVQRHAQVLGRPILVGHSMGGMVALLAGRGPAAARGIVLVDAYPHLGLPAPFNRSFWSGTPDDLRHSITQGMLQTRRRLPVSLWQSVGDLHVPTTQVSVPVLGIYGDRGESDHEALREALLSVGLGDLCRFDARFVPDSGHFPMLEHPDRFAEALDAALEDVLRRAQGQGAAHREDRP